jgi:hypothetical protein
MMTRKLSIGKHHCSSTLACPPIQSIVETPDSEAATDSFSALVTIASPQKSRGLHGKLRKPQQAVSGDPACQAKTHFPVDRAHECPSFVPVELA